MVNRSILLKHVAYWFFLWFYHWENITEFFIDVSKNFSGNKKLTWESHLFVNKCVCSFGWGLDFVWLFLNFVCCSGIFFFSCFICVKQLVNQESFSRWILWYIKETVSPLSFVFSKPQSNPFLLKKYSFQMTDEWRHPSACK